MGISSLRPILQSLCCNSPWSYAVFWKLKHQHEMKLVWEDGFCDIMKPKDSMMGSVEDPYLENSNKILSTFNSRIHDGTSVEYSVGFAVTEMSSASHILGKGIVGEAAYTGNARWIYSDSIATDLLDSVLVNEYPDEWLLQFAAGIKTILLLPISTHGVLQLGSVEMVAEDASLVAYVKYKFEAYKESDGCDWGYSTHQFSLMSTFLENFEEPSTITMEQLNEDHRSINTDKTNDCDLSASHMMPVFTVRDQFNTSLRGVTNTFEPSYEDNKSVTTENNISKFVLHDERIRALPNFNNFHWGMYEDFVNELMDIHSEEGGSQPAFADNDFDIAINDRENNSFSFPRDCELYKTVEPSLEGINHHYMYDSSILGHNIDHSLVHSIDMSGMESSGFHMKELDIEHLLEAVIANVHRNSDDNSSNKSNVTSCNISSGKLLASSKMAHQSKRRASEEGTVEGKMSVLSNKPQRKLSRMSTTNKRKVRCEDNQKPRPRDRQLIQDRIKELRELVPNSEKSSIDGLLDQTIKHMLFLRSVTNQADKLRRQILKEEDDEMIIKPAEHDSHKNGTSWAVELGNEQQLCPIVVKDLDQPGHMLIEMLCTDHARFLKIADVIHRLKLTILKGVMEKRSDNSRASFVVETSGSFHRLDIFWPLMKLLQ